MITRYFSGGELYEILGQYEWNDLIEWCEGRGCTCEIKSFPVDIFDDDENVKFEMKLVVTFPDQDTAMMFKLTWK